MVARATPSSEPFREELAFTIMESPVGMLLLAGNGQGLWLVSFGHGRGGVGPAGPWHESTDGVVGEAKRQLDAYFRRELRSFTLPLHPCGTEFQRRVWAALASIPYGATLSYGELAQRIERPTAVRAVGAANGANPLSIVLPCHRVIGTGGALIGYGGGLGAKAALLALERGELVY